MILAIDPGNIQSAYVIWAADNVSIAEKVSNKEVKQMIVANRLYIESVVIEGVAHFGMPVGKEVFETCYFIGQLQQLCESVGRPYCMVMRREVKLHFCNSVRAKDGNIRQALIDRFGDKGTKKNPGKTYGLSGDTWSAFALAVYYSDIKIEKAVNF